MEGEGDRGRKFMTGGGNSNGGHSTFITSAMFKQSTGNRLAKQRSV